MNIIIDKNTRDQLFKYQKDTIEFGSGLKGTADDNSDKDLMHIIEPNAKWERAPYHTHHLLQYRTPDGNDEIFCTPQTFVKSLIDGDTTIFHEMLRFGALSNTCLATLEKYSDHFNHYKTLRSYLGIARRDLKEATKIYTRDQRKALKKVRFAVDAYNYVNNTRGSDNTINYREPTNIQELQSQCVHMQHLVDDLRADMNADLDNGRIQRSVDIQTLEQIDEWLAQFGYQSYSAGLSYFRESFVNGN